MSTASKESKKILMMLVENNYGVTSRISGVFSRRGFNMDSFTGCDMLNAKYSRITVVVKGDDRSLTQIEKQVSKLEDVLYITDLASCDSVCRMLMLLKVKVDPAQRQSFMAVTDIFHGRTVDVSTDSMIVELTGSQDKLNAYVRVVSGDFEILEVASSGMIGLERGASTVHSPADIDKDSD